MNTYEITLPSGTVARITSKRAVSHVVVGTVRPRGESDEGMLSMHGSLKAAEKGAATARGRGWGGVQVVVARTVADVA